MKTTKKTMFAAISTAIAMMDNVENKQEMLDFLAHEVELIDAKAERVKSQPSKPSKSVQENDAIRTELLAFFRTQAELVTLKELTEQDEFASYSTNKLAQLIAPMVKAGTVRKDKVGKVMGYGIA